MRGTLRMPNAMVTASKLRSGSGSASALASMKSIVVPGLGGALAADREHLGVDVGDGDVRAGPPASATRKAMSPVPPATSSSANGRLRLSAG